MSAVPQKIRELIASSPPRTLRLVKPRKPRGYWLKGGIGGERILELMKDPRMTPAEVARKLGQPYGNIYAVGLRLGCWTERKHHDAPQHDYLRRNREAQEILWDGAPIFERYGRADAYASVPAHVSKSGGMK